jgi:hypothetical protein
MPIQQGQSFTFVYTAWDFVNNVGKTGDAANHTLRLIRDGIEITPTNSPTEVDATNAPGEYELNVTGTENNATLLALVGKSSTVGVSIIPNQIQTVN